MKFKSFILLNIYLYFQRDKVCLCKQDFDKMKEPNPSKKLIIYSTFYSKSTFLPIIADAYMKLLFLFDFQED